MLQGTGGDMGQSMWTAFEARMAQRYGEGVNLGNMSAEEAKNYAKESARLAWRDMGAALEEWLIAHIRVRIGDPDMANVIPLADETPLVASSATHTHSTMIENNRIT